MGTFLLCILQENLVSSFFVNNLQGHLLDSQRSSTKMDFQIDKGMDGEKYSQKLFFLGRPSPYGLWIFEINLMHNNYYVQVLYRSKSDRKKQPTYNGMILGSS